MSESIQEKLMLKEGTVLHNSYRIVGYLASGGFGNTYVAEHIALGYRRAIKEFFMRGISSREDNNTTVCITIASNKVIYEEQKNKFIKEAQRISRLSNNHIIKVYDLFEENNTCYYVMDLIEGESLLEKERDMGHPFSEKEVIDITKQMLDALDIVHHNELLHLDIKPGNILMDSSGHCTLIDFGSSKQIDSLKNNTVSTAMTYTPGYSPTEQITGSRKRQGPWTDFYALGATVYKLISDKTPPLIDDISADGEKAFEFPENVSEIIRSLVLWMMKTDISNRPKNVKEIKQFLESTNKEEKDKTSIVESHLDNDEKTIAVANPQIKEDGEKQTKKSNNNFFKRHFLLFSILAIGIIAAVFCFLFVKSHKLQPTDPEQTSNLSEKNEQNEINKLAYNFGFTQSDGLKQYMTYQLGIDMEYLDDFINGMEEGVAQNGINEYTENESYTNSKSDQVRINGITVGKQVKYMAKELNMEIYQDSTEMHVVPEPILRGLVDGLRMEDGPEKTEKMKQANDSIEVHIEKFRNRVIEQKYGDWKKENEAYLESNKMKPGVTTLACGVQYRVLVPGGGVAMDKDSIVVADYIGKLIDGTEFDTSKGKDPILINMKHPSVISGWVEVLKIMPKHAKWEVVIPQEQGYGNREMGPIKPFSTLIFIIETK